MELRLADLRSRGSVDLLLSVLKKGPVDLLFYNEIKARIIAEVKGNLPHISLSVFRDAPTFCFEVNPDGFVLVSKKTTVGTVVVLK